MKRKILALLICLCVLLLAGCQKKEQQRFDYFGNMEGQQGGQISQPNVPQENHQPPEIPQPEGNAPNQDIDFDSGDYDPSSEEGLGGDDVLMGLLDAVEPTIQLTPAPTVHSQYAGATPVWIAPIDMPTATVVPPLTFTYQTYEATNLGLTFEGPMGWVVEDSLSDSYIIYNPDPTMSYRATMTLVATHVTEQYEESDLTKAVKNMLSNIRASGVSDWSPSNTAPRTLLGYPGVYANYTGTLEGTEVAGRVHMTYANSTLFTLHVTYPRVYSDTYKEGVYDKVRNTLKIVQ